VRCWLPIRVSATLSPFGPFRALFYYHYFYIYFFISLWYYLTTAIRSTFSKAFMKIRLYSIHDRLLKAYLSPFAARADVEAVRQLRASMQDPQMAKSGLVTTPQDYDLYYVGTFDDETGLITAGWAGDPGNHAPALILPLSKINAFEVTYAEKVGSDHAI